MTQYATIAQGNAHMLLRLNTSAWDDATDTDKDKALNQSTSAMDMLNYRGIKNSVGQANQFPRGDDTTIPSDIVSACIENSLSLLDGIDPDLELDSARIKEATFGGQKTVYRDGIPEYVLAGLASPIAWRFIKPWMRDPQQIRIERL